MNPLDAINPIGSISWLIMIIVIYMLHVTIGQDNKKTGAFFKEGSCLFVTIDTPRSSSTRNHPILKCRN